MSPWYVVIGSSVVAGLVTALVNVWLQYKATQRVEKQKAIETRRQDQQRAENAAALEQVRAHLAKLTQLSTSSEQKRAEVAAAALVALLRMLDALHDVTSMGIFDPNDDSDVPKRQEGVSLKDVEAREASILPYDQEFQRAWHGAEVYLPDDVTELFDGTNRLRSDILMAQRMHAMYVSTGHAVGFYTGG